MRSRSFGRTAPTLPSPDLAGTSTATAWLSLQRQCETSLSVDLSLSVAPVAWTVAAYKEDRILTLSESGEPDDDDLAVALTDHVGTNLSAYGAEDESALTINGRPALLGRQAAEAGGFRWILEANTASGHSFSLQAPDGLTRDQVIAVARGVTYEP
jgi:hypothetical protein